MANNNILRNLVRTGGALYSAIQSAVFDNGGGSFVRASRSIASAINFETEVGDLTDSDLIMIFESWKMRQFPEAYLSLRQRNNDGTKEIVAQHPALDVMRTPNIIFDMDQMLQFLLLQYDITETHIFSSFATVQGDPRSYGLSPLINAILTSPMTKHSMTLTICTIQNPVIRYVCQQRMLSTSNLALIHLIFATELVLCDYFSARCTRKA